MPRSLRVLVPCVAAACIVAACGGNSPAEDGGPPPGDAGAADAARAADTSIDAAMSGDSTAGPEAGAQLCPPHAPFGSAVGETSPDVMLMDCDGNAHSLYSLCGRRVVWLFEYADWCPPCRNFAMSGANAIYDRNIAAHGAEFEGWMVVSETASFGPATRATCAAVRDRYGTHMPVLIDPSGALQAAFGVAPNEVQILLTRGARVRWIGHYASGEVGAQIDAAFAP